MSGKICNIVHGQIDNGCYIMKVVKTERRFFFSKKILTKQNIVKEYIGLPTLVREWPAGQISKGPPASPGVWSVCYLNMIKFFS